MDLQNKVAWVTGGAKRLGRAIALDLARRGADIALHYRGSEADARAVASEIEALGRRAVLVQAELSDIIQIERAVGEIETAFGRLDVLINSASNFLRTPLAEIDEANWDASLDVNLKGPAFCAFHAARLMQQSDGIKKIVNFADSAVSRPYRNYLPYIISKAGIVMLTRTLALELAPKITVNAVAPGVVLPPEGIPADEVERLGRAVPMGRIGAPEDIVATVAFLLEGSDYITGQIIAVDGGRDVGGAVRDTTAG